MELKSGMVVRLKTLEELIEAEGVFLKELGGNAFSYACDSWAENITDRMVPFFGTEVTVREVTPWTLKGSLNDCIMFCILEDPFWFAFDSQWIDAVISE